MAQQCRHSESEKYKYLKNEKHFVIQNPFVTLLHCVFFVAILPGYINESEIFLVMHVSANVSNADTELYSNILYIDQTLTQVHFAVGLGLILSLVLCHSPSLTPLPP